MNICDCYKFSLCCDNLNYCSHIAVAPNTYPYMATYTSHRHIGTHNANNTIFS